MKEILISVLLIVCLNKISQGQKNFYGLNVGVGGGTILKKTLMGGASYDINTGLSLGLNYNRSFTKKLSLMTGLSWYNNSITVTPVVYPGIDRTPKKYKVQLIYIPLLLKVELGKYFFINGGIIGDIDITNKKSITNQSGIGASLGIGMEYLVNDKFLIQMNPYLNFHGLILTNEEKYSERIFDAGIKLSLFLSK